MAPSELRVLDAQRRFRGFELAFHLFKRLFDLLRYLVSILSVFPEVR